MVLLIVSYYVCAYEKVNFLSLSFFIFKRGGYYLLFFHLLFFNSKATYYQRKSGQVFLLIKQAKGDLFRLKFWQGVSDETSIWRPDISQVS